MYFFETTPLRSAKEGTPDAPLPELSEATIEGGNGFSALLADTSMGGDDLRNDFGLAGIGAGELTHVETRSFSGASMTGASMHAQSGEHNASFLPPVDTHAAGQGPSGRAITERATAHCNNALISSPAVPTVQRDVAEAMGHRSSARKYDADRAHVATSATTDATAQMATAPGRGGAGTSEGQPLTTPAPVAHLGSVQALAVGQGGGLEQTKGEQRGVRHDERSFGRAQGELRGHTKDWEGRSKSTEPPLAAHVDAGLQKNQSSEIDVRPEMDVLRGPSEAAFADATETKFTTQSLNAAHQGQRFLDIQRAFALQIAEMSRSAPDAPIEVTLRPEELGRVRMSFQAEATTLNVSLQFERPDTLELMRRHISDLSQEMLALGFEDVQFTFNQGSSQSDGDREDQSRAGVLDQENPEADVWPSKPSIQLGVITGDGLDLRV